MKSLDELRAILNEVEKIAPRLDAFPYEMETYARDIMKRARVMDYSDVASPEALLIAALMMQLRSVIYKMERALGGNPRLRY